MHKLISSRWRRVVSVLVLVLAFGAVLVACHKDNTEALNDSKFWTNGRRVQAGGSSMTNTDSLNWTAQAWANELHDRNSPTGCSYFEHSPNGGTYNENIECIGGFDFDCDKGWASLALDDLWASTPHRTNWMNPAHHAYGVGVSCTDDTMFTVQHFGP